MKYLPFFSMLMLICSVCKPAADAEQPNILLIMVDDMGYSDIYYFGGEIHIPKMLKI
jgi:arylsulfatase